MRLTCPNCDAQYEVPDEVIPTSGRDVQCSNCGQTWFQHHPDTPPVEEETELTLEGPTPDEEVSPPPPPTPPTSQEPERRQLDPAVADILRQEAEAEFEARRKRQAESLESQPDLGLEGADEPVAAETFSDQDSDADRRAEDARKRMARMRGEPEDTMEVAASAAAISSRRELLPDIEEINSTLRSDATPSGNDPDAREELGAGGAAKRKRSFRGGFYTVLLIAVLLTLVYIYAPQISQAVPAVDPFLNQYVTWVDQLRISLDGYLKNLLTWLDEQAVRSEG